MSEPAKGSQGVRGLALPGECRLAQGERREPVLSQASAGPGWCGPGFPSIPLPVWPSEPLDLWCTGPLGFHGGLESLHWASEEAHICLLQEKETPPSLHQASQTNAPYPRLQRQGL